ncbi:MAG: hypothetical protein MUC63_05295 [Planctomycetes bacterium]|jgi:hypothetical protein|nr:hypothetical protein [Planctomycetota bacterium]
MNRTFPVLIGAFAAFALAAVLALFLAAPRRAEEPLEPAAAGPAGGAAARDARVAELERENRALRDEVRVLKDLVEASAKAGGPAKAPAGGAPAAAPSDPAAPAGAAPAGAPAEPGAKKEAEAVSWDSLSRRVAGLLALVKRDGNQATPELMQAVSGFMADLARMQKQLGLDDSGLVTEAPAFKAGFVARFLEQEGKPLAAAEKAELERAAEASMEEYLRAARPDPEGFALDRVRQVVKNSAGFEERMGRIIGADRLQGLPGQEEGKNRGQVDKTPWPDQACAGVKDLDEAAEWLARRWSEKMGVREEDGPALRAIAREYAERSQGARLATGVEKESDFTPETRAALDQELAGLQLEALRRIHDTLPLTEAGRKKVKGYRSLDRFELGRKGSFSRTGSFGGVMIDAGGEEERRETK